MKHRKQIENYGTVNFVFNQYLKDALDNISSLENEDGYTQILYDTEKQSSPEEKNNELSEMKEFVKRIYEDCSEIATEAIISKYSKKKNGKFRKGAIEYFKVGETCSRFETEFTNSWETIVVSGKAISESEIEVNVGFKWFNY